jgi:diguanylate cyclase (GGDEF)-like protein
MPASPPDDAIGNAGWIVAGGIVAIGILGAVGLAHGRATNFPILLLVAGAAVVGLAVLEWLAGGVHAPYDRILLLPIVYTAAIHPPRRIAAFLLLVAAALAVPFVYDGWNIEQAGSAAAAFVIWTALAVVINLLMSGVRAQRIAAARGEATARQEARVDPLTGLANRRAFDEVLEREIARSRAREQPLSLAMVDIENFKDINDRWGHAAGDRCLREVATALRASLREPDLCFRWGGDEFMVVLPGASGAESELVGARLRDGIGAACRRPDDSPVTARFASAELLDDMEATELSEMAGIAMSASKAPAGGR